MLFVIWIAGTINKLKYPTLDRTLAVFTFLTAGKGERRVDRDDVVW